MQVQELVLIRANLKLISMKRLWLIFISLGFVLIGNYSWAQSVSPKAITSAGGSVAVGNIQVSRSIGETFIIPSPLNTVSVSRGFQQNTSSISIGTIVGTTFCSGATLAIPFTAVDIFGSGNVFTAELSDNNGSFASPVSIGTLNGNVSGSIQAVIPLNTITGIGYRIRVRSSSPMVYSLPNPTNLTINQTPQVTATNTGPYFVGQTIALSATSGGSTYQWAGPNSFTSSAQSPTIPNSLQANAGVYTVTVGYNGCTATATTRVVINGDDPCVRIIDYYYNKSGDPYTSLFPLVDGMVIDQVPYQVNISLVPSCNSFHIGSFDLTMVGPDLNWNIMQEIAPYTVFDNRGNHYFGMNLKPGSYTLTATGYSQGNRGGNVIYSKVIRFTIVGNLSTISLPTLSTTNLCAGTNVDVSFSTTGTFAPGNVFQAQLSNIYGNFEAPAATVIGTSTTPGTINATIPLNVVGGSNYRIRVASSNQTLAGNPTMSVMTVNPLNQSFTAPITGGDNLYKVSGEITGTNKLVNPAKVTYQAAKAVVLMPGFETQGAGFKAEIKACNQ